MSFSGELIIQMCVLLWGDGKPGLLTCDGQILFKITNLGKLNFQFYIQIMLVAQEMEFIKENATAIYITFCGRNKRKNLAAYCCSLA